MTEYFPIRRKELRLLKQRDKRLSEIIDKVGWGKKESHSEPFCSIGTFHRRGAANFKKAHETIWQRIQSSLGELHHKES